MTTVAVADDAAVVFAPGVTGGYQLPAGTVKKTGSPANVPGEYVVMVHAQWSGVLVKKLLSDPLTGAYQVQGVASGNYYVLALDHTGELGGVIETDIVAEPMP